MTISEGNYGAGTGLGFLSTLFTTSLGGFYSTDGTHYTDVLSNGREHTYDLARFSARTLEGLGGWQPPDGTHIVPYGGGFRINNDDQTAWRSGNHRDYSQNNQYDEGGNGTHDGRGYGGRDSDLSQEEWEELFENSFGEDWRGSTPILLDLDGNGLSVTELDASTTFIDTANDGLSHRTAWAGAGDGVLFFDADGSGDISSTREFVFTEWDPTSASDIEALRSVFDTNGDGKLTAADDGWSSFRVMVTLDDGATVVRTLDQLGITEIDLTDNATQIELPDGSIINGTAGFTYAELMR